MCNSLNMYELYEMWQKISVKKLYRYGKILYTIFIMRANWTK